MRQLLITAALFLSATAMAVPPKLITDAIPETPQLDDKQAFYNIWSLAKPDGTLVSKEDLSTLPYSVFTQQVKIDTSEKIFIGSAGYFIPSQAFPDEDSTSDETTYLFRNGQYYACLAIPPSTTSDIRLYSYVVPITIHLEDDYKFVAGIGLQSLGTGNTINDISTMNDYLAGYVPNYPLAGKGVGGVCFQKELGPIGLTLNGNSVDDFKYVNTENTSENIPQVLFIDPTVNSLSNPERGQPTIGKVHLTSDYKYMRIICPPVSKSADYILFGGMSCVALGDWTGVNVLDPDNEAEVAGQGVYYDLLGRSVGSHNNPPAHGVYIFRDSDGSSRKVLL